MHLFGLCCKFFTQMTISFIKIILTLFSYYKVIMNTFHFGPNHLLACKIKNLHIRYVG